MTKRLTYLGNHSFIASAAALVLIFALQAPLQISAQSTSSDLFKVLDANSDGSLSPYEALDVLLEIESQSKKKLTAKRINRLIQQIEEEGREEVEGFLKEMDRNKDGKVQLKEVDGEMREFASMFDRNDDGIISIDEALKAEENMSEEMFLSADEIDEEVEHIFEALDSNEDGVLVESEADEDLSWDQIREGDSNGDQKVSTDEFKEFLAADNKRAEFKLEGNIATMEGVINADTPATVLQLIFENPSVRTIVMKNVPGSIDDEANLRAARYVRKFGFTTIIKSNGSVASGGTDFFLAGAKRIVENGGKLGIHSWGGPGIQGKDVPKDDPQHQLYLKYYEEMGIPAEFYWRTLEAAPANDIHWMTEEEIKKFNVRAGSTATQQDKIETGENNHSTSESPYAIERKINGATILATRGVDPAYVDIAGEVYRHITSRSDPFDIRALHEKSKFKIILITEDDRFSELPHYRGQGREIDRAGGLGGEIGEFYIGVRVGEPHVLVHELGHGIYHSAIQFDETGGATDVEAWYEKRVQAVYGMDIESAIDKHGESLIHEVLLAPKNTFSARLADAWKNAQIKKLWKGTYAGSEPNEYWAEGVTMWFGAYSDVNGDSRAYLLKKDPGLYKICESIFPGDKWTPADAAKAVGADVAFENENVADDAQTDEQQIEELFVELDLNRDNKISRDEVPDDLQDDFDQADASGDGFVTKAELQAAIQEQDESEDDDLR